MSRRRGVAARVVRVTRSSRHDELQTLANRHPLASFVGGVAMGQGDGPSAFDLFDDPVDVVAVADL